MRIVITDSQSPSLDIEREVAAQAGAQLVIAHGLSPTEIIAIAQGADSLSLSAEGWTG